MVKWEYSRISWDKREIVWEYTSPKGIVDRRLITTYKGTDMGALPAISREVVVFIAALGTHSWELIGKEDLWGTLFIFKRPIQE
jgi:hypothetical protein